MGLGGASGQARLHGERATSPPPQPEDSCSPPESRHGIRNVLDDSDKCRTSRGIGHVTLGNVFGEGISSTPYTQLIYHSTR